MIVVADSDQAFHSRVAQLLGRDDIHGVDGLDELEATVARRRGAVAVALIGPNVSTAEALTVAAKLQLGAPETSVVFVAHTITADLLQAALRAGVRDILPASFTRDQFAETVTRAEEVSRQLQDRAAAEVPEGEEDEGEHRIITVFSSKGGAGKSFVASNLAVLLAERTGKRVAMVDLDLQFGDLAIMLQLFPARTISDAAQNLDHLDAEALDSYLVPHRSLVHLLAAPLEPGLAETVSAEHVKQILGMLRERFDYVVVDSPPSFTEHVLTAIDESETLVLVTTMDVPSIKNLKLSLQALELLGMGRDRLRLVLNRADSKVGLGMHEVEKTIGTKVDLAVPSSREVPLSINRGAPLVADDPRSPVGSALSQLADLVGVPAPARHQAPSGGRRLRLWRARR